MLFGKTKCYLSRNFSTFKNSWRNLNFEEMKIVAWKVKGVRSGNGISNQSWFFFNFRKRKAPNLVIQDTNLHVQHFKNGPTRIILKIFLQNEQCWRFGTFQMPHLWFTFNFGRISSSAMSASKNQIALFLNTLKHLSTS